MRVLLLMLVSVLSGCATAATAVLPNGDIEARATFAASAGPVRSTTSGRTQTVGLPLSRAGKIGLWAGVAVALAYLMASDGEDDVAAPADP
jgi:uncharacterized protein YceK